MLAAVPNSCKNTSEAIGNSFEFQNQSIFLHDFRIKLNLKCLFNQFVQSPNI